MVEKWRDERGETLIEVLASIVVMALSILMLFGAVVSSSRINKSAKGADDAYYSILSAAEKQKAGTKVTDSNVVPATPAEVMVTQIKPVPASGNDASVEVDFYGGKGALSYRLASPSGP